MWASLRTLRRQSYVLYVVQAYIRYVGKLTSQQVLLPSQLLVRNTGICWKLLSLLNCSKGIAWARQFLCKIGARPRILRSVQNFLWLYFGNEKVIRQCFPMEWAPAITACDLWPFINFIC
ncbi:hypothetical protein CDAR_53101 [Caerostris darwini]|uniref:Uncharacterized protein n=1 Tax=Caerostris darwini TaxID=1538125 RepID=A0AAV4QQW7_9ARAC|nr:hypothetical protein CDAR_53101 [Caerostris darwini]